MLRPQYTSQNHHPKIPELSKVAVRGRLLFTLMAAFILIGLMALCMEVITSGADDIMEYLGTRFGRMGDLSRHVESGVSKVAGGINQLSHTLSTALVNDTKQAHGKGAGQIQKDGVGAKGLPGGK